MSAWITATAPPATQPSDDSYEWTMTTAPSANPRERWSSVSVETVRGLSERATESASLIAQTMIGTVPPSALHAAPVT